MTTHITPMTMEDYDEVVAFWKGKEGLGINQSDSREGIAVFLERNPGLSLVARSRGGVIGAVLCGHDGRRGYLHHLAVDEEFRRQGVGRQMVNHCMKELHKQGIPKCNILLFTENETGKAFWNRIGFRHRHDLVLMQALVPAPTSAQLRHS